MNVRCYFNKNNILLSGPHLAKRVTMKRLSFRDSSGSSASDDDEQITEAIVDAIEGSNDKVVEIRPVSNSSGWRRIPGLLLLAGAVGGLLWWRKSQTSSEFVQDAAEKTAERTQEVTEQAAETVQSSGEAIADQVETESKKAGDHVEQLGSDAAEKTEAAGEEVSKRTTTNGDSDTTYAEKTDESSDSSEHDTETADKTSSSSSS